MSIKISSLVWQHYPAGGSELLTALAYADHAHDDGTSIRPSVEYVAKKTRQSERTVQRYLASMRRSGWLQTVRFAHGGRGRATEYRVNPMWITNPSFSCLSSHTMTASAENGDVRGIERVAQLPPQPSLIVNETTQNHREGVLSSLSWPKTLQTAITAQIIKQCPSELRQAVLDEITALEKLGQVRSAIGLLRKLVERAIDGEFSPTAARKYNEKTKPNAMQKKPITAPRHAMQNLNFDRSIGREHLSKLKKTRGLPQLQPTIKTES